MAANDRVVLITPEERREGDPTPGMDFVHVPKGVIHRESNPANRESHIVVVRAGNGPPTINVDGPQPGAPDR
jgi:uncharacterized RmlC-like cupin family protein